jgi:hypothetical protein
VIVLNDPSDKFQAAIVSAGLTPPDAVVADGKLHRFSSDGGDFPVATLCSTINRPEGGYVGQNVIKQCIPLTQETRTALPTNEAAWHLSRAEQTLRLWACEDNGPIRPIRLHGRLMWPTDRIRELLGVGVGS